MRRVRSARRSSFSCSATEARWSRYSGKAAHRFTPQSKAISSCRRVGVTLPLPVVTGMMPDQCRQDR